MYLMYSHLPSVATPISPMVFFFPSWVFKKNDISLLHAASGNYDISTLCLTDKCSASELHLHNLWGERDLNPQSRPTQHLQCCPLPITVYLPNLGVRWDLNPRPLAPQANALPTELLTQWIRRESNPPLSPCKGETPALVHASPLFLWERRDSNPLRFLCIGFTVRRPSAI